MRKYVPCFFFFEGEGGYGTGSILIILKVMCQDIRLK